MSHDFSFINTYIDVPKIIVYLSNIVWSFFQFEESRKLNISWRQLITRSCERCSNVYCLVANHNSVFVTGIKSCVWMAVLITSQICSMGFIASYLSAKTCVDIVQNALQTSHEQYRPEDTLYYHLGISHNHLGKWS